VSESFDEKVSMMRAALKLARRMRHLQKIQDMNSPGQSELEMRLAEREFDWALELVMEELNDE
jgi:hypothetical protein